MLQLPVLFSFVTIIVAGGFALNTHGIQFPYFWHPDEIGKVDQVLTGQYNFYHPQLLLHAASVLKKVSGAADTVRETVIVGRFVSAGATAIATAAFATIVFRRYGPAFGAITAILIAITPSVFLNAHYFKEDASLLMGVALTMLAMQSVEAKPERKNIIFLGLALGLTLSAKYVGAFMIIPVIALLIFRVKLGQMVLCLAIAALLFLCINSPGIIGRSSLMSGLAYEFRHVTTSHGGVAWGPTSLGALKLFMNSTSIAIICLWLWGLIASLTRWKNQSRADGKAIPFECLLFLTPCLLLMANQFSMVNLPRYFVTATALVTVSAIWAVADFFSRSKRTTTRYAPIAVVAFAGASLLWSFSATASVFHSDPRANLAVWIANNLPPDAKIAQDFYSGLPTADRAARDPEIKLLPQSVTTAYFHMGAAGSFTALRSQGYTHMVISSGGFDRFYDSTAKLDSKAIDQKKFFDEVFRILRPVYEMPKKSDVDFVLSSRILVYDLRN